MVSIILFGNSVNGFIEWISKATHISDWIAGLHSKIISFLFAFAGVVLWLVLMLLYFSLFKYLWLIVGSPLFAYLSEKTEAIMEGRDYPFNLQQLLKDILRGVLIALRNTLWQTVYILSLLILSFIPLVGWAAPVIVLLVECYYYGFSMLDYSCERRKMTAAESIYFIGNHKGLAIGNGIVFYLMHIVPIIGWVLAPAYAVIAATLSMMRVKDKAVVVQL